MEIIIIIIWFVSGALPLFLSFPKWLYPNNPIITSIIHIIGGTLSFVLFIDLFLTDNDTKKEVKRKLRIK
jgi:hypothetical protein